MEIEQELKSVLAQKELCIALIQYIGLQPLRPDPDAKIIESRKWLQAVNENMGDTIRGLKAQIKMRDDESVKEPVAPEHAPENP